MTKQQKLAKRWYQLKKKDKKWVAARRAATRRWQLRNPHHRAVTPFKRNCNQCKKHYEGQGDKFCSRKCAAIWQATQPGYKPPGWNGGRYTDMSGYIRVSVPNHPMANKGGYAMEHRYLMSEHLKRPLTKNEIVHHMNGIKSDNRIENLIIVLRKTHMGKVVCPHCQKGFCIK